LWYYRLVFIFKDYLVVNYEADNELDKLWYSPTLSEVLWCSSTLNEELWYLLPEISNQILSHFSTQPRVPIRLLREFAREL
jgi:hypothetical protein